MSQKFSIKKIYSFYLSYAPAFLLEVLIQVVQVACQADGAWWWPPMWCE